MNKVNDIYQILRRRIEENEFAPGTRFPSEYQLAEECHINKKTANIAVSLLVRDGFLRRGTRGAGTFVVKQNIFPKGYIAFVGIYSAYNTRILNGLQQTALASGYATMVIFSDKAQIRLHLEALSSSEIKGIITAGYAGLLVHKLNLPVVQVDFNMAGEKEGVYVNTDNRRGAYELMCEILRRGHRNILIYCGGRQFQVRQERINGFLAAMKERGIPSPERFVINGARTVTDAKVFISKMRSGFPETTIVACDGDDTAQALWAAAIQEKISIPKELCITSYGNTLTSVLPIASVEQYPEKIGAIAGAKIIDSIESGKMPKSQIELIKPDITGMSYIPDLSVQAFD